MAFKIGQEIFVPAMTPFVGRVSGERGIGVGSEYRLESQAGEDFGWWSEDELILAHDARLMFTEGERASIDRAALDLDFPSGGKPLEVMVPVLPDLADRLSALSREYPKSAKQFIILRSITTV